MKKGNSIYNPYYSKIHDLLFQGMPMMEVYEYMKIFFNVYADYKTFWRYVKRNKLDWYMPVVGGNDEKKNNSGTYLR